jgi:hypothetical protein
MARAHVIVPPRPCFESGRRVGCMKLLFAAGGLAEMRAFVVDRINEAKLAVNKDTKIQLLTSVLETMLRDKTQQVSSRAQGRTQGRSVNRPHLTSYRMLRAPCSAPRAP